MKGFINLVKKYLLVLLVMILSVISSVSVMAGTYDDYSTDENTNSTVYFSNSEYYKTIKMGGRTTVTYYIKDKSVTNDDLTITGDIDYFEWEVNPYTGGGYISIRNPKKIGKATIYIANANTNEIYDSAIITIIPDRLHIGAEGKDSFILSNLKLVKGETVQLTHNCDYEGNWSVSDESIAVVDSLGKLTAKEKGKATVTLDILGVTESITINVAQPKLSKSKISIYNGATTKINLSGVKNGVSFKIKNPKIAKIVKTSNGVCTIKGIKNGTTQLIAELNGEKYTCSVNVKKPKADFIVGLLYNDSANTGHFQMEIENCSSKKMQILDTVTYSCIGYPGLKRVGKLHDKYSYIKSQTIKPGHREWVRFFYDTPTYYDAKDCIIDFEIKFEGKTYSCTVRGRDANSRMEVRCAA